MPTCTHLDHVRVTQPPDSVEGREDWSWCSADVFTLLIPEVAGATRVPSSPLG